MRPPDPSPALRAYAQRHRLDPDSTRSDGRLTLRVDGRWRVHLQPGPDGRTVVWARLLDLSGVLKRPQAEAAMLRLCAQAATLVRAHAAGLSLDERSEALVLQQMVPSDADLPTLEAAIADFLNTLPLWSDLCAREARTLHA